MKSPKQRAKKKKKKKKTDELAFFQNFKASLLENKYTIIKFYPTFSICVDFYYSHKWVILVDY